MSADALLQHLESARKTGHNRWKACCPAHQDKIPSLAVREEDDGRVLIKCFAGCSVESILDSVGLTFSDLYPMRPPRPEGCRPIKRPFVPADVFEAIRHESHVLGFIAKDMRTGKVSETDYRRLIDAEERIEAINGAAYGS